MSRAFNMRLTPEDDERLARVSAKLGLSHSETVRLLLKRADRGEGSEAPAIPPSPPTPQGSSEAAKPPTPTRLDAVGTSGGKATLETYAPSFGPVVRKPGSMLKAKR